MQAASLVSGSRIVSAGDAEFLRFEGAMLKAHEALLLLGIDSNDLNIVPDEAPE